MDNQNWDTITITRPDFAKTRASVGRPAKTQEAAASRKLEQTEIGKLKQLTIESRTEMVQKRVALGKNQVALNQDCRFPVNTIRDIEAGRLCPTPTQLAVLNRVLKASLKYA